MKKSVGFAVIALALLHSPVKVKAEEPQMADTQEVIGLWSESYADAREWLSTQKFPLKVTLPGDTTGKGPSYIIPSLDDQPKENVPAPCPKGTHPAGGCWFVKYGY